MPPQVREYVEQRAARLGHAALEQAAEALSEHYRAGRPTASAPLSREEKVVAYLATRMPATFAAADLVLREAGRRLGGLRISSSLDLGAGTGAATLAAREVFPDLLEATLLEADPSFAGAGRQLLPEQRWIESDLREAGPWQTHDLVLACYTLGELDDPERIAALDRAWQAARIALVLIEPGTTRGFHWVREARDRLIRQGGRVLAPCPGDGPCPIASPDWCHFGARVERSSLHRRTKRAALGYEDEKFSYVALARAFAGRTPGRIVRRPGRHAGWIDLTVCGREGIRPEKITRRQGPAWRAARKAEWGGTWPPDTYTPHT
ncbi:MAG: rRNA methyltransferase [Acidobacteria bacterium]|nr:rRNA methyltransferase [Acidobacteriota bacterium]